MKQLFNLRILLTILSVCYCIVSCKSKKEKNTRHIQAITIATVDYDYSGCFSSGKSKLVIYKIGNSTLARLENDGKLAVRVELFPWQIDSFRMFINNLREFKEGGYCTTVSHYSANLENEQINRTDRSCGWEGFTKLKNNLFGSEFSQ